MPWPVGAILELDVTDMKIHVNYIFTNAFTKKSLRLLLVFIQLIAFSAQGTTRIKLNQTYNGRSTAKFRARDNNIIENVRAGSVGTVLEVKRFSRTGNAGIKVQLGEEYNNKVVWIYDWSNRTDDILKCVDAECTETTEYYSDANYARAEEDQNGYRDPDAADEANYLEPTDEIRNAEDFDEQAWTEARSAVCGDCERPNGIFSQLGEISRVIEEYTTIRDRRAAERAARRSATTCFQPTAGRVSSGYGMRMHPILDYRRMHRGLDMRGRRGASIFAARSGIVRMAGRIGSLGNAVVIEHQIEGNPTLKFTRYGHMSRIVVSNGQSVEAGQLIGHVGSTGLSTGPHLHFETHDAASVGAISGSTAVDPTSVCQEWSNDAEGL